MIIPAARLYSLAYTRYALGHFNIAHMEQILGVFRGALAAQAPFILAMTPVARRYACWKIWSKPRTICSLMPCWPCISITATRLAVTTPFSRGRIRR